MRSASTGRDVGAVAGDALGSDAPAGRRMPGSTKTCEAVEKGFETKGLAIVIGLRCLGQKRLVTGLHRHCWSLELDEPLHQSLDVLNGGGHQHLLGYVS